MKYKLGEICEIVSGSTPKTSVPEYWDGDVKWITPAEVSDDSYIIEDSIRHITELGVQKTGLSSFPKGTVILSSRAPIGKVAIAGCEMYCNQGFKNLICSDAIDNRYLYWFLKGNTEYLNSLGRGATFKEISKQIVSSIEITVPDHEEQMTAVEALEKVARVIRLRKQQLAALDDLIKARFVEMFGDPETNPKGWKKKPLAEVITAANNGMARRGNNEDGNIVMRLVELQDGYIDYSNPNRIVLTDAEKKRYLLKDKDFLFARVNGNPDNVGRCAVFNDIGEPVYHNDHIIRVHFNDSAVDGAFASALLNSTYGKRQLKNQLKTSAGQYTVSQDGIGAVVAILPPIELQREFADFVKQVGKSKVVVHKALDEAQVLFDSLMQQYFG